MKIYLIVGLVALAVATESITNSSEADNQEWTLFKTRFNKVYNHQKEEEYRRKLYFKYKSKMNEHNKLYEKRDKLYKFGINQFSDISDDEIVGKQPCFKLTDGKIDNNKTVDFPKNRRLPPTIDWRKKGCVTHVRNQGVCGSCWAFGAIETLESQYCLKHGKLISLSEQNLVDCSETSHGCEGGLPSLAFEWIKDNKGIASEKDYPYESTDGWDRSCIHGYIKSKVQVEDYKRIRAGKEKDLLEAVANVGPISVAIHVLPTLQRYEGTGVYFDPDCRSDFPFINHAVVVDGYGTTPEGEDYWLVRNSWGAQWGDSGYVKMARNKKNHCGIASYAYYPIVN